MHYLYLFNISREKTKIWMLIYMNQTGNNNHHYVISSEDIWSWKGKLHNWLYSGTFTMDWLIQCVWLPLYINSFSVISDFYFKVTIFTLSLFSYLVEKKIEELKKSCVVLFWRNFQRCNTYGILNSMSPKPQFKTRTNWCNWLHHQPHDIWKIAKIYILRRNCVDLLLALLFSNIIFFGILWTTNFRGGHLTSVGRQCHTLVTLYFFTWRSS